MTAGHEHDASDVYFSPEEGSVPGYLHGIIAGLRRQIAALEKRVKSLEAQTPSAQRLQYEADIAMADASEYYGEES